MNFGEYSKYYDLLYKDKNYSAEVMFVLAKLAENGISAPTTLLDLGCGTGRHALEMSSRGVEVTGVDLSEHMLQSGRAMMANAKLPNCPELLFGDARTVRLEKKFDAVTSLFHVISYQTTELDALALLTTAWEHLMPGGVFLFDFWFGAGVLSDPPTYREKIMEDAHTHVLRTATPVHRIEQNIVEVNYNISLTDKTNSLTSQLVEKHTMRYWFLPELSYLAKNVGFTVRQSGSWLSNHPVHLSTWNGWLLLQR